MSKQNLVVVISPDGSVNVAAEGIKGQSCQPIVEGFAALFGEAVDGKHTPEFWQRVEASPVQVNSDDSIISS